MIMKINQLRSYETEQYGEKDSNNKKGRVRRLTYCFIRQTKYCPINSLHSSFLPFFDLIHLRNASASFLHSPNEHVSESKIGNGKGFFIRLCNELKLLENLNLKM